MGRGVLVDEDEWRRVVAATRFVEAIDRRSSPVVGGLRGGGSGATSICQTANMQICFLTSLTPSSPPSNPTLLYPGEILSIVGPPRAQFGLATIEGPPFLWVWFFNGFVPTNLLNAYIGYMGPANIMGDGRALFACDLLGTGSGAAGMMQWFRVTSTTAGAHGYPTTFQSLAPDNTFTDTTTGCWSQFPDGYLPDAADVSLPTHFLGYLAGNAADGNPLVSSDRVELFQASGASHKQGLVPDPGSSAGTTHFLREDATWAVPATSDFSGARVTMAGTQSLANNALTVCHFDTTDFDTNSYWDGTNFQFNVTGPAYFLIGGGLNLSYNGTTVHYNAVRIDYDGSPIVGIQVDDTEPLGTGSGAELAVGATLFHAASGSHNFQIKYSNNISSGVTVSHGVNEVSNFWIQKVG